MNRQDYFSVKANSSRRMPQFDGDLIDLHWLATLGVTHDAIATVICVTFLATVGYA
jgi:hypothetical protein